MNATQNAVKAKWLIRKSDGGVIVVLAEDAQSAVKAAQLYLDADVEVITAEYYCGRERGINTLKNIEVWS